MFHVSSGDIELVISIIRAAVFGSLLGVNDVAELKLPTMNAEGEAGDITSGVANFVADLGSLPGWHRQVRNPRREIKAATGS